jgi:hypothetical protein
MSKITLTYWLSPEGQKAAMKAGVNAKVVQKMVTSQ